MYLITGAPSRTVHMMTHVPPPRTTYPPPSVQQPTSQAPSQAQPPPPVGFYGSYHPHPESNEEPPYTNHPPAYVEPFESEAQNPPTDTPEQNPGRGEDETSGEFGGLVSYFSSQRDEDLES